MNFSMLIVRTQVRTSSKKVKMAERKINIRKLTADGYFFRHRKNLVDALEKSMNCKEI